MLKRNPTERSIINAYATVAWFYNGWSRLTEFRAAEKAIEFAAVRDGERVLEVAVGTGRVFAELVRRNPGGLTDGLDLSPAMLAKAETLMAGVSKERYHLQPGSAYSLPFTAGTFDLLVNNFMLDLMPEEDFPVVLAEFSRVLKPGGRIVLSTMSSGRNWYNRAWGWIAEMVPSLLTGCRPIGIGTYLPEAGFQSVESVLISQNTFPSEVLWARKRME